MSSIGAEPTQNRFMPNTFTQIYFHLIFAVQGRNNLISEQWEVQLHKYITGIVTNKSQKMIAINGMPDHIHILVGCKPDCILSDLVRDIKSNSSRWINNKKFKNIRFEWQKGFGAFSVSHSKLDVVGNYIKNQKEHHLKKSFKNEYVEFLENNEIEFNEKYIFK